MSFLRDRSKGRKHRCRLQKKTRPRVLALETRRLLSYVVNDSGDLPLDPTMGPGETSAGTITLRSAIDQINLDGGGDIFFGVPQVDCSTLPDIAVPAFIDGGSVGSVVIAGSGLVFEAADSAAENLVVYGASNSDGIDLLGDGSAAVDDYVGTDASGLVQGPIPNSLTGIVVTGSNDEVLNCVVAGNLGDGINVEGAGAASDLVQGCLVGVGADGATVIPNSGWGVGVFGGATSNTIGGTSSGTGNIVLGNGSSGLLIADAGTADNLIQGNLVSGNKGDGVDFIDSSSNLAQGNFVGVNQAGTQTMPNSGVGIGVFAGSANNTIGGSTAGSGNVVSGNSADGIDISDSSGNLVEGNLVGVNQAGTKALPNAGAGIGVFGGSTNNTIGGSTTGSGNILSGNQVNGLFVADAGTSANLVEGNLVGVDASGSLAIPNAGAALVIANTASGNTIGGSTAGSGNVVSGNAVDGIDISNSSGNLVEGNLVGVNQAGTKALPNAGAGIGVFGGSADNTIGGSTPSASNVLSGNGFSGLVISDGETSKNVVEGNLVGVNSAGFAIPNAGPGLFIANTASGNTIGGSTAGSANVVSGNAADGIDISDSSGNLVEGNLIGVNPSATEAVPNVNSGIVIFGGSSKNTIGGQSGKGNVISGNNGDGVTIDGLGTSQNVVEGNFIGTTFSDATGLGNNGEGVSLSNNASNNTIGGSSASAANVISGNRLDGVDITSGAEQNAVDANRIGVDQLGKTAIPNGGAGVVLFDASLNAVGGGSSGKTNIISGNLGMGVELFGSGTTKNSVEHNLIGTDSSGTVAIGNGTYGVGIYDGASGNTVGGGSASKGNLISGNQAAGVFISDAGTNRNLVQGNLIGTDTSGTKAIGNISQGIFIGAGATNNTVGGTTKGARNLISGNSGDGVDITSAGTTGNVVLGNLIGSDTTGLSPLGNTGDGVAVTDGASNVVIGGSSTGSGNLIAGNGVVGVWISGSSTTAITVAGNKIGIDGKGKTAMGNGGDGVLVDSGATRITIGGSTSSARNVISGNGNGIQLVGSKTADNLIEGDFVGTNASGTAAVPNTGWGILLSDAGPNNTIGGAASGAGDVISGNGQGGIEILGSSATAELVEGNMIGTNVKGRIAIGNALNGIELGNGGVLGDATSNDTIGGTARGAGNIISGNGQNGVWITGAGADQILIVGNEIGVASGGKKALGNSGNGVLVDSGASNDTIGGTTAGSANIIAFNGQNGVQVGDNTTDPCIGDSILANSIFSNQILGINLGDEPSPTGNPIRSSPSGPNNLQNAPVIASATTTSLVGSLSAAPDTIYQIQFFSNRHGSGQGKTFLATISVTTDSNGLATIRFSPRTKFGAGLTITATATDPGGNTSEFSAPITVAKQSVTALVVGADFPSRPPMSFLTANSAAVERNQPSLGILGWSPDLDPIRKTTGLARGRPRLERVS